MGRMENITVDYLSQPEVFASLFNGFVFGGNQIIKPESLREVDGRFRFLLSDDIAGNKKDTYDTLDYLKQAKAIEQEHKRKKDVKGREFLSHFKKEDVLIPTITIVFYIGKEEWDAARDLKGLFGDVPYLDSIQPFMVSSPLNLISVYDVEDTAKYQGSLHQVFELLKYVDDGNAMLDFIQNNRDTYSKLDEATARLLSVLIDMDFLENQEEGQKDGEVDMCKALEEIKKMSEDKGIKQGETTILLSMLNKGMTCEEISSLTDIPLDKVKKIAMNQ